MPPVEAVLRPLVAVVALRCLTVEPPDPPLPLGEIVRAGERPPEPTLVELGEAGWKQEQ